MSTTPCRSRPGRWPTTPMNVSRPAPAPSTFTPVAWAAARRSSLTPARRRSKPSAAISRILDAGGVRPPRLQHGLGACAWPVLRDALARGYDLRIGLEDTLTLRDNSRAAGNAELVASVARLVSQIPAPR